MRNFFTALLGACFLIMTNSANADSGPTLLLDTTKGQVEIRMLPDLAPNHVARITELATSGFYDGVIFHRVIPGFMAQTGFISCHWESSALPLASYYFQNYQNACRQTMILEQRRLFVGQEK